VLLDEVEREGVVTRVPVAKGSSIMVVAVGSRQILVGASEHHVTMLSELSSDDMLSFTTPAQDRAAPIQPVSPGGPGTGFVKRLQQMTLRSPDARPSRARRD